MSAKAKVRLLFVVSSLTVILLFVGLFTGLNEQRLYMALVTAGCLSVVFTSAATLRERPVRALLEIGIWALAAITIFGEMVSP